MQISSINNVITPKRLNFGKKNAVATPVAPKIQDEVKIEKTKKALSRCRTVIFGLVLLYVALKRVSRYEQAINAEKIRSAVDNLHI